MALAWPGPGPARSGGDDVTATRLFESAEKSIAEPAIARLILETMITWP